MSETNAPAGDAGSSESTNVEAQTTTTESTQAVDQATPTTGEASSQAPEGQEVDQAVAEATEGQSSEVKEGLEESAEQLKDAAQVEEEAADELNDAIKAYKVIVNGEEREVTQEELVRGYQTMRAAQEKFEEAAKYRKQAEKAFNILKRNPALVLQEVGVNPRQFAEEYLAGELQKELLTPEEQKQFEMEEELRTLREEKKQRELDEQQRRDIENEKREAADLDQKTTDALSKSGLPKTPKTVALVGQYLADAYDMGYEHVQPQDVIELVREDYNSILKETLSAAEGDQLINLIGEDTVKKIRQYDVGRVNAKKATSVDSEIKPTKSPEDAQKEEKKEKMSISDWKAHLENKYK